LIGAVDQDWTENSRIPIFLSLSLAAAAALSFSLVFLIFSHLFAAAKGRFNNPTLPNGPLHMG
jgi:hypothetical protein